MNNDRDAHHHHLSTNAETKKLRPTLTAAFSYISIAALIVSVLSLGYRSSPDQTPVFGAVGAQAATQEGSGVDQVAAAGLAANVAETADISVEANVSNMSTSLNARTELAQSNEDYASKPQMVAESQANGVKSYKVKKGDNINTVAATHKVKPDTVRWANNVSGDALEVNRNITIPTVDGVVYTMKNGDTAESLASKYKADKDRLISFNDAEINGLKQGQQIVIPGGTPPENERPGYTPPRSSTMYADSGSYGAPAVSATSFSPVYGDNGYAPGYCTWYVASRISIPRNWGNANTWAHYAKMSGWNVSSTPTVGSIAQRGGGFGHVAIVEAVSPDGRQIKYSDMNGLSGFGAVGTTKDWVSASQYQNYISR